MKKTILLLACLLLVSTTALAAPNPQVVFETTKGFFTVELYPDKTPITVENFLRYVDEGAYDGTIFHRVIGNFMIQGGGFDTSMKQRDTHKPIPNEADKGGKNKRGTIAMARTSAPHSASNQFFINVVDNDFLDFKSRSSQGWGYCVFGKVIKGMETVDVIRKMPTGSKGMYRDVPVVPVIIKKAYRKKTDTK